MRFERRGSPQKRSIAIDFRGYDGATAPVA